MVDVSIYLVSETTDVLVIHSVILFVDFLYLLALEPFSLDLKSLLILALFINYSFITFELADEPHP